MRKLIRITVTGLLLYYNRDLEYVANVLQATREMGKSATSLVSVLLTMEAVTHWLAVWTTLVSKIKSTFQTEEFYKTLYQLYILWHVLSFVIFNPFTILHGVGDRHKAFKRFVSTSTTVKRLY